MYKIKSLCSHKQVIDLPRSPTEMVMDEELEENNERQWDTIGNTKIPKYMLELQLVKPDMPVEFNRKVFKLIDLALEDARKR